MAQPKRSRTAGEVAAYNVGRALALGEPAPVRTFVERREVHLPTGEVLVEEHIVIEEPN